MEQILERYILEHPDYWEFENEAKEVAILKELCDNKTIKRNINCSLPSEDRSLFNSQKYMILHS
ncbi:MAG: hypothetical protein JXA77_05735 [Bacteroidales bacterium]|nr:hypothetical protein [Bacteroidales bacterium]